MNEEEIIPECMLFVLLCGELRHELDQIKTSAYSSRVWAAVCCQKIIDLCKEQPNSEKAFNEVMGAMEMSFEDQVGVK